MKKYVVPLTIATIVLPAAVAWAATNDPITSTQPTQVSQTQVQTKGWLGVRLDQVPQALSVQLGHLIPQGQGVLVQSVDTGSAAEKADVKPFDVLLSYNDQKLYSIEQLARLVANTKPDTAVDIQVVQQGKLNTIKTVIAARPVPAVKKQAFQPWWQQNPNNQQALQGKNKTKLFGWDSFESINVKTLADGRYHAEVTYKEGDEQKNFVFEGKKEELIEQIQASKDLPIEKQEALLNALNGQAAPHAGQMFNHPFFQGQNPFMNDPFFQGNPFANDPFFQQQLRALPPAFQQMFNPRHNNGYQAPQPVNPPASAITM